MKLVDTHRENFALLAHYYFDTHLKIEPIAAELGVHRGDFSSVILKHLSPKSLTLCDAWSAEIISQSYERKNEAHNWVNDLTARSAYYGGPIDQQGTLESNHQFVIDRFSHDTRVQISKSSTADYLEQQIESGVVFDYVYLDASHEYYDVVSDLTLIARCIKPTSIVVLNDCCTGIEARKQNFGVLEALSFCRKFIDLEPVAMTWTNYSDVLCSSAQTAHVLQQIIEKSDLSWVEFPSALLPSCQLHKPIGSNRSRPNISFR